MEQRRYREIQKVQVVVILFNLLVSTAKIVYGWWTQSAAMVADGVHSLTDGFNNVIGLVGVYFAFRPWDEKHPYGHKKFQTMTTLIIGGLLLILSTNLIRGAYVRWFHPVAPTVELGSFVVMLFSISTNIFVTRYEAKRGKELGSDFLVADSTHTMSDVYVSISVTGTLTAVRMGYPWMDTVASVVIAALIAKAAIKILAQSANVLCDASVLDPIEVSRVIGCLEGISSCHQVRTRGRNDDIHVDLHVVVADEDMNVQESHSLAHQISGILMSTFPGVTTVHLHIEPPEMQRPVC